MSFQKIMLLTGTVLLTGLFAGCGKTEHVSGSETKILSVRFYTLEKNSNGRYRMFPGIIQPEDRSIFLFAWTDS